MDFATAPELDEIRSAVRTLCARFPGTYWRALEPDRYPEEFVRALTEDGWLAALIPEEYGGAGLSLTAASVILEEINASGCNAAACHAQMYTMGTVLRHGSEEQKRRFLPPIAAGELRLQAFGVTEPRAGSDTTRIETTAERVDGGYRIRGQKIWTSRALHSDLMLLLARTRSTRALDLRRRHARGARRANDDDPPDRDDDEPRHDGGLPRRSRSPGGRAVGEEGNGFRQILDGMNAERILIAAECIGDGRWFVERAARYASERVVFGRPIGENQGVQFPIAAAHAAIEAADLMRWKAAWLLRPGRAVRRRGEHGEAARVAGIVAGGERLPRHARRRRLRGGVRRRAEVPRDAALHGGARLEQPRARLPRPQRPRAAEVDEL